MRACHREGQRGVAGPNKDVSGPRSESPVMSRSTLIGAAARSSVGYIETRRSEEIRISDLGCAVEASSRREPSDHTSHKGPGRHRVFERRTGPRDRAASGRLRRSADGEVPAARSLRLGPQDLATTLARRKLPRLFVSDEVVPQLPHALTRWVA